MQRIDVSASNAAKLIPDFCRGRTILILAFAMQLIAIVLTLAGGHHGVELPMHVGWLSLYLQWIGLCSAAALCWARRHLAGLRPGVVFPLAWSLLVMVSTAIGAAAFELGLRVPLLPNFPSESRVEFLLRTTCIAAIVALLLLRYFWLRQQWRDQVQAEGESRYQALNARIQPHFLFNSLNSIAALIQPRPKEAEALVEDLSDLFRASMREPAERVPLGEELALIQSYLRIEQVRMGDRLRIEWDVPDEFERWPVPMFAIQPLVENAVHHGISRLRDPGVLRVSVREARKQLLIDIENPLPPDDAGTSAGNRIAVSNIAQRLHLIYGEAASLKLGRDGNRFRARLTLPLAAITDGERT